MMAPWLAHRPGLRAALGETVVLQIKLREQLQRHEEAMIRWQRRIVLAEQHGEFDLATRAAQLARWHAAQVRFVAAMLAEAPPPNPSPAPPERGVQRAATDEPYPPLHGSGEGLGRGAKWMA